VQAFKFGCIRDDKEEEYSYPDIWTLEKTSGSDRLVIGPSAQHVSLMLELLSLIPEPLAILYVLVVPRTEGVTAGRYQSSTPRFREQTESFLTRFGDYFERDGLHHIWIASMSTSDLLVYDRHNVIYAYGQLAAYEKILVQRGLKRADVVAFPVPHVHNYNAVYDSEQNAILRYSQWNESPLQEQDE